MARAFYPTRSLCVAHAVLGLSILLAIFVAGQCLVRMHVDAQAYRALPPKLREAGAASRADPGKGRAVASAGVPTWKPPRKHLGKMVAVFPVGSTTPATEAWVRGTREWRRGIPAIVGSFDEPNPENALDAALHNETWVTWTMRPDELYPGQPFMSLVAMTLGLAADRLNAAGGFDWVLFGDDDTVFNLDVLADMVELFDACEPHMLTDHLWFRYNGTSYEHGSLVAPRCVPCGVEAPEVQGVPGWRPPQACPACTWDLLRDSDPTRPAIYSERGFNPVYLPDYELIAHGGAGMLLSRGLIAKLNSTYLHDCITTKFTDAFVPGSDTLTSHCIFMLNVAPTDPGVFAATGFQAFAPNECQALCAIEDSFRYTKGFDCCDEACAYRLRVTASTHLRSAHFASRVHALEAMHAVTRARDGYLFARYLDRTGGAVHQLGTWDTNKVCL